MDIVGLIPAVGNIADLLNAGISALRGDFVGAGLSLAAAIPLAGLFAGGAKVVRSGAKLINKGIKSSKKTIQSGKNLLKNTKKVEKNRKLTEKVDEVARSEFIPYKNSNALITTANATKDVIENAVRQIYKDYPEILKALKL